MIINSKNNRYLKQASFLKLIFPLPQNDTANVDENAPECVDETKRILQPKNKSISDDNNGVKKQEQVHDNGIPCEHVQIAKPNREWSEEVHQQIGEHNQDAAEQGHPAKWRDQLVDQNPFEIRAELLVPDDAGTQAANHKCEEETHSHCNVFQSRIFKYQSKCELTDVAHIGAHFSLLRKAFIECPIILSEREKNAKNELTWNLLMMKASIW